MTVKTLKRKPNVYSTFVKDHYHDKALDGLAPKDKMRALGDLWSDAKDKVDVKAIRPITRRVKSTPNNIKTLEMFGKLTRKQQGDVLRHYAEQETKLGGFNFGHLLHSIGHVVKKGLNVVADVANGIQTGLDAVAPVIQVAKTIGELAGSKKPVKKRVLKQPVKRYSLV